MNNLLEELNKYQALTSTRNNLNSELLNLSGKNDQESIKRINEIGANLNQISKSLQNYDKEKLDKVTKYYETKKEFDRLVGELQTIEKLSKKSNGEKTETLSSEGRKKYIDKSLLEEYNRLAKEKSELRRRFNSEYKELEGIITLVDDVPAETEEQVETTSRDYELPIKSYEELTPEEKQKELEDRLQRIFNSSKLPNQGKKMIVTYNGKKYSIPRAYQGRFNETVRELNTIKKSMNSSKEAPKKEEPQKVQAPLEPQKNLDAKLDEIYVKPTIVEPVKQSTKAPSLEEENPYIYGHYDPRPKPLTLPDLISMCEKNKIELHPVPVTFRRKHKVDMKKAFTCIKSKVSLGNFKKLLPKVWNIDKQVELAFANMNNKLLNKRITIKTKAVNFAEGTIQKYNTVKTHVTNIPKRTKEYIKDKYKSFNNYFREKKEVSRLRKEENYSRKEAMEMVYGEKVDKHLDYRIVNRTAKFKENTCQKINTAKGKIVGTTKAVIDDIKKPFDYLRENMKNDIKRQELQAKIDEVRIANRQKEAALRRIKVNSNAGYVGTVALIIISVFALAAIIFMGIGSIINR